MVSPPPPVPLVWYYMYHYAPAKNDPFDSNYNADLAPYLIDVAVDTHAPVLDDVAWQIYAASGDSTTAFLLCMDTPRMDDDVDPGRIVLLKYVS